MNLESIPQIMHLLARYEQVSRQIISSIPRAVVEVGDIRLVLEDAEILSDLSDVLYDAVTSGDLAAFVYWDKRVYNGKIQGDFEQLELTVEMYYLAILMIKELILMVYQYNLILY